MRRRFASIGLFVLLGAGLGLPALAERFDAVLPLSELNTEYQEKSPSISADRLEIFFHSNRVLDGENPFYTYVARRAETGVPFDEPVPILEGAVTPDIASDGLTLYFAMDVGSGNESNADLFFATRADRDSPFGPPVPMVELNTPYKEASPSISTDRRVLYFDSDRPGGAGQTDLWVAVRSDPSLPFDAPSNLTEINTAFREITPSISRDGRRLYFASNRPGTLGGMDIWVADRTAPGEPFGQPRNVEEVNSAAIEKACDISADGLFLYLRIKDEGETGQSDIAVGVDPKSGNVNRGVGAPAEVLAVNGSLGDDLRTIHLAPAEPIAVTLDVSPAGPSPAAYALYALAAPTEDPILAPQPYSLGTTALPTPLDGGFPAPMVIANLFSGPHGSRFGVARFDLPPAPGTILERPGGVGRTGRFVIQGFLKDAGSVSPYPVSITNAVVLVVD